MPAPGGNADLRAMPDQVFIVLFRGVGGETKLPSAPLRDALTAAGFGDVTTYIATGNVVLTSGLSAGIVQERVAAIARKKLGFAKEIFVRTRREWAKIIRDNPFPEGAANPRTLHAFILRAKPPKAAIEALLAKASGNERLTVKVTTLYFHAPDGFGRSKMPAAIERTLKGETTARNWNTMVKLDELAKAAAARRS